MKYVKMLGLLAVAAAALMAFAGTASAKLTEGAGDETDKGETIHATSTNSVLDGSVTISCTHSTVHGTITNAGGTSGNIGELTFTGCGNDTVTVGKAGSLAIESLGGGKGTLRSTGAEVTVLTHQAFLGTTHCIYVTSNTHIGTVTGGTPASLSIDSAPIPEKETDFLCGNDAEWTGSYTVKTPGTLLID